jgi:hypothetical protein
MSAPSDDKNSPQAGAQRCVGSHTAARHNGAVQPVGHPYATHWHACQITSCRRDDRHARQSPRVAEAAPCTHLHVCGQHDIHHQAAYACETLLGEMCQEPPLCRLLALQHRLMPRYITHTIVSNAAQSPEIGGDRPFHPPSCQWEPDSRTMFQSRTLAPLVEAPF